MKSLVTTRLGIKLNERLAAISASKEYGYRYELMLMFCTNKMGVGISVTEQEFQDSKNKCEIGIFGTEDPTEAIQLLRATYPSVPIIMRLDPKPRGKR